MNLRERFLAFAGSRGAPAAVAERWWRELESRYSEPHRHYHTLTHVEHLLELLPHAGETVLAAIWFHDVIYGGDANEERSAALARTALTELGFGEGAIAAVEKMILATKSHSDRGLDQDGREFLDADLAILGSDPDRYRAYVAQVRKEYAHVPDAMFRSGRNAILRTFLARPRIYFTDGFFERFERKARENMEREIED
jgi:predicted metal-dependent HD superfamily phosphohydrolase